ncbi:aminopeptidase, partial [Plakobranchus ocellatus]
MQHESFPDVTLAEPNGAEQFTALTSLQRSDDMEEADSKTVSGNGKVIFFTSKNKRFLGFSRLAVVFIALAFLFLLILAIVTSVLITKSVFKDFSSATEPSSPSSSRSSSTFIFGVSYPSCLDQCTTRCRATVMNASDRAIQAIVDTYLDPAFRNEAKAKGDYPDKLRNLLDNITGFRLPRIVTPSLYNLLLKVDVRGKKYEGSVNITVKVEESSKYIVFHRNDIEIDESLVNLASQNSPSRKVVKHFQVPLLNFHVLELDGDLQVGATYTVIIGKYWADLHQDLRGLYLSSYNTSDGVTRDLVASQLQPEDARRLMPCLDEPAMKARFSVSIIYEKGYTALTNMSPKSTISLDEKWKQTDYHITPFMSTYLLAVVVSDFKPRNFTFEDGYELRMWAREDAHSQTEYAMDFAIKAYKFFVDYFGMKDVVTKSDHVAVPDFNHGAMENWGLVVYRETSMLYDRQVSSTRNKFMVTLIVAHEIAHTFALQVVDEMFPIMIQDALTTSHPIFAVIEKPSDIMQNFDGISYQKGMAVLRMMMDFTGTEQFRHALTVYVKKFKFKNADMSQLWDTFSQVIPAANRATLIGDAFTFARADMLSYDVALSMTRYLKKEQSYIPWRAFAHIIKFLRGMLANKAAYVHLE